MSLPLQDVGNIKVDQATHSWLKAESQIRGLEMTTIIRQIVYNHASSALLVANLAQEIHRCKGFEEIVSDLKR